MRVKLDPGSRTSGLAVVNDADGEVVWAAELEHRGQQVRDALLARRAIRRSRRQRHTRYRPTRFANRRRRASWLPPSLESRLANTLTWADRLQRLCPIGAVSQELVRFDTQLLENAEISGVEYRQGELAGYEVREYLLEKWGRSCAYCGQTNVPLEVEHIVPRTRGGSNRVSNLTIACHDCNDAKGARTAAEWGYPQVQAQAKTPHRDAAAVNATRWELYQRLVQTGLPVETGSGGRTKWNRTRRGLPKTYWLDAACEGAGSPDDHSDGAAQLAHVPDERLWISRQGAQGDQRGRGIPHWRHCARARSQREQEGRRSCGTHCHSGKWFMQHQNGDGYNPGHSLSLLSAAASRRWLCLHERSGASFPCVMAGNCCAEYSDEHAA